MEQEVPRPRTILKQLNSMLTMKDTLAVYKDFYKRMGIPEYFVMAARKTLEWADVYPLLYLHSAFQGLKESHITRHISANLLTLTIYTVWRICGQSMTRLSLWNRIRVTVLPMKSCGLQRKSIMYPPWNRCSATGNLRRCSRAWTLQMKSGR